MRMSPDCEQERAVAALVKMFLYEAYRLLGVSIASLAYYCGPLIVMLCAPILFQEKLTWTKMIGFLVVLVGAFWINGQALQAGKTSWGIVCGTMSALMYAVMVIFNKKVEHITGLENALLQLLFACFTVAIFVAWKQRALMQISGKDWPAILLLGVLNTGIGCYFYFSSIGHLPVQTVLTCGYLEPLASVLFSVLFLGEVLSPL